MSGRRTQTIDETKLRGDTRQEGPAVCSGQVESEYEGGEGKDDGE